jgi:hypothetical protein
VTVLAAAAFAVVFVVSASGTLSNSTFDASDGNLTATATATDWCTDTPAPTTTQCVTPFPGLLTALDTPAGSQTDDSFANGTKQDNAVPSVGTGGVPNKGDLDRFYFANSLQNAKNFLYLAFELLPVPNSSASVHTGFEFNQNYCDPNAAQTGQNQCSANNVTPVRQVNDTLIVFDLEGGGTPALSYRYWVDSGACEISQDSPPCGGPKQTLGSSVAEASLDTSASGTFDPIAGTRTIQQYRFGEAAINLTDSNLLKGCQGLGSVYSVSRSSGDSGTATMKDFIAPRRINVNNCGTLIVKKLTVPSTDTSTTFNFTTTGSGLSNFSLTGNNSSTTFTGLNPGSGYAVAESPTSGRDLTSSTCTSSAGGSAFSPSSITITAGATVTCTFTNTQRGSLEIDKVTNPSSDTTTTFSFTAGGGLSPTSFSLTGGTSKTYSNLTPGSGY